MNSTPFVSDLLDLGILKAEYADNKFENCFDALYTRYKRVRRLRRDGNCFYRAFLFQLFEHFIGEKGAEYERFLKMVVDSKDDLVKNGGYDEVAIEDFHDVFVKAVQKLKDVPAKNAVDHCMSVLCNHEDANYIIMYARFMTATYLKKNSILFEDFVGDVTQFCLREVEQLDVECDHPQILGITQYFGLGVEINSVN